MNADFSEKDMSEGYSILTIIIFVKWKFSVKWKIITESDNKREIGSILIFH